MVRIVVRARVDGRGGFSPFRTHPSAHAGEYVIVGGRPAKVSSDGRVNIPKALMEQVGVLGDDGRYRVAVEVGVRTDSDRGRHYGLYLSTPPQSLRNAGSGVVVPEGVPFVGDAILPSDTKEYYLED